MTTVAFIQARMGSTRLPGKVLEPLAGQPALVRIVERIGRAAGLDGVAVLTSDRPQDRPIRDLAVEIGVPVVAGSEHDVLARFELGVRQLGADRIVRVTADCPLIDPDVVSDLLALQERTGADHAAVATGALAPQPGLARFPDGLDAEVVPAAALELAAQEATDPYDREHVTPFLWRRPDRFRLELLEAPVDMGDERWTVDHAEDLAFVRAVYERFGGTDFGWRDIMALLHDAPQLRALNASARREAESVRTSRDGMSG